MTTARNIITLALEGMNKLSPGEAIDADLAAACLRRLNSIADGWGAGRDMLFRDVITSGAVTGVSLTLGSGAFAAVASGDQPAQIVADNYPVEPITMQQYNEILQKTTAGRPLFWAWDGASTVYLYPAAAGQTIGILTREAFAVFADLDTVYSMPSGYEGAFAASLAVAMAPALLGKVPDALERAERKALFGVQGSNIRPAIVSACKPLGGSILQGWN